MKSLCNEFCDIAGLDHVEPEQRGPDATVAVLALQGVELHLLGLNGSADRLFSLVVFGHVRSEGGDDDTQTWARLLDYNFDLFCFGHCTFSRDPDSGQLILQQAWDASVRPHELFATLSRQCGVARDWQQGRLCTLALGDHLAQLEPGIEDQSSRLTPQSVAAFARLCDEVRQAADMAELPVQSLPDRVAVFMLDVDGVRVQVCQYAHRPSRVQVIVELGAVHALDRSATCGLAEANAWLLAHPQNAVVCHRALTGDAVLCVALPLDEHASGEVLLRCIRSQADATRRIWSERHLAEATN